MKRGFKLADIFPPSERHSDYYLPLTSSGPLEPVEYSATSFPHKNDGSDSPLPNEFEKAHIFTGIWSPGLRTPKNFTERESLPLPSLASQNNVIASRLSLSSSVQEISISNHWFLNPKLLGIPIRVDIQGGPCDTVEKQKKGATFAKLNVQNDILVPVVTHGRGPQIVVPVECILKFPERPKPGSERSLMVVIEGPHAGKYVCQVYHFYQGSKAPGNDKFIAVVTDHCSNVERVTEEYLNLDPNEVELVEETAHEQKYMNQVLKDIRDAFRTSPPAICS